jgi:uncharacterized protein YggE
MKTILFSLLCLIAHNLFGQAAGNAIYSQNRSYLDDGRKTATIPGIISPEFISDSTIELKVRTLYNAKPDSYVVILGVSQVGLSVDSCHRLLNDRLNGLLNRLAALGIARNQTHVDFVSQIPVFEYAVEKKLFSKSYNEVPKGFDLKKNLHIAYKTNSQLDALLIEAARFEIYDVVKVDYVIDNTQRIYDTLRTAAVNLIKKKTEDLTKVNVRFNSLFQTVAEEMNCTFPIDRYKSYSAFANASLSAMKKGDPKTGELYPAQKPVTVYYDALPYNIQEIVINPKVVEPVPQFSYTLAVRYTFRKEIPKPAAFATGLK